MNKIYLFFILVCCVQSYLLPFSCRLRLRFSLPLIKITARRDRQTANAKKLTKAGDRNPPITAHTLTSVWLLCFLRGQVRCTDYWKQNGIHVTVFWVWTSELAHTRLLEKKKKKSVVFQKTVIESTFDYRIEAKYEYWIVHFMNGLLNHFFEIIFSLMNLLVR